MKLTSKHKMTLLVASLKAFNQVVEELDLSEYPEVEPLRMRMADAICKERLEHQRKESKCKK